MRAPDLRTSCRTVQMGTCPHRFRHHTPPHAQDSYGEAFNHAFASHRKEIRQEEIAHRTAWAAVTRSYVKSGERVVRLHSR